MSALLQVRADDELTDWLVGRAGRSLDSDESPSLRMRTEVQLWRAAMRAELEAQSWTLAELGCIADVIGGGGVPDAISTGLGRVAAEVADAMRLRGPDELTAEHGIDEAVLWRRLLRLGPVADHALMDAMARWWETGGLHTAGGWAAVGLTVRDA